MRVGVRVRVRVRVTGPLSRIRIWMWMWMRMRRKFGGKGLRIGFEGHGCMRCGGERAVEIPDIETISAKGDTPLSYRRG